MDDVIRDAKADALHRIAQAKELMLRFEEAKGRPPVDMKDIELWVASHDQERPIRPRSELLDSTQKIAEEFVLSLRKLVINFHHEGLSFEVLASELRDTSVALEEALR